MLNKEQIKQIKFLLNCLSKDKTREVLTGVLAHSKNELIATNSVILCKLNIEHNLEIEKIHKIGIKDKQLISYGQILGNYPCWKNVIPLENEKIGVLNFVDKIDYLPIAKMLKIVNFNYELLKGIPAGQYDFFVDYKQLNKPFLLQNDTIQITIMPCKIVDHCYNFNDINNIAIDFKDYIVKIFES